MDEIIIQRAQYYATVHQLRLMERLGFGIHGIIFAAQNNSQKGNTAIKAHRSVEPYFRERDIYKRLNEAQLGETKVQEILGALEELDIHMIDVSPSNIAFLD